MPSERAHLVSCGSRRLKIQAFSGIITLGLKRRIIAVVLLGFTAIGIAACSGATTAPSLPPPQAPAGWKLVTYQGIGLDVPHAWAVEPWHANCGVTFPTVFIGPEGAESLGCPTIAIGSEVVLGARLPNSGVSWTTTTINGLKAMMRTTHTIFHGHASGTSTQIWVRLASGISISVSVGDSSAFPGGAPGRANQIVRTIHATPDQCRGC
jgi:hypothetical protein